MPNTRTSEQPEIIQPGVDKPEIPEPPTRSPEIQQPYPKKPEISTPPDPEAPPPTPQPEIPRQPGTPEIQPGSIEAGRSDDPGPNTSVEGSEPDVNRSPASRDDDRSIEGGGSDDPGPIEGSPRGAFTF